VNNLRKKIYTQIKNPASSHFWDHLLTGKLNPIWYQIAFRLSNEIKKALGVVNLLQAPTSLLRLWSNGEIK